MTEPRFVGPFWYGAHVRTTEAPAGKYDYRLPGDAFDESARWWREKYPELIERVADPDRRWPRWRPHTRTSPAGLVGKPRGPYDVRAERA